MTDDQDRCEWVNVSSGTSYLGCTGQNPDSLKTVVCVCVSDMTDNSWEKPNSYLLHFLRSNNRIVLADLGLGKCMIIKGALMHVRVAMHTAEVTSTATIKT